MTSGPMLAYPTSVASVTCIGRGQAKTMAVVMVVSATFDVAKQVGTEFTQRLKQPFQERK